MDYSQTGCIQLSDEAMEQIKTLDYSRLFTLLIIVALFISLNNIDLQKTQICCSASSGTTCQCPKANALKVCSTTLVMISLSYFYLLTRKTAWQADFCNCSYNLNYLASILTLAAVVVRYGDLLFAQKI